MDVIFVPILFYMKASVGVKKVLKGKVCLIAISFFAIMFTSHLGWAQTQRPKIGLVLSGGGAKGIAHVRILLGFWIHWGLYPIILPARVWARWLADYMHPVIRHIKLTLSPRLLIGAVFFPIQFCLTKSILKRKMNLVVTFMSFH